MKEHELHSELVKLLKENQLWEIIQALGAICYSESAKREEPMGGTFHTTGEKLYNFSVNSFITKCKI